MRILITGAAGYLGGKISEALLLKNGVKKVVGTDIHPKPIDHPKYRFYLRDIRDRLDDIFSLEAIDTIIHMAYVVSPIHNKSLMEDINKGGVRNILEASRKAGVGQILYTSSTAAYGFHPDNDQPLRESSPLRGNDDYTYAKNKKEIEGLLAEFGSLNPEMAITIVRPCIVVGPGFNNPMARHLKKKRVIHPANPQPWQMVHEDDLVGIMTLLLEKKIAGVFNVAGDGTISFPEMIQMMGHKGQPLPWRLIYTLNQLAWYLGRSLFPSPSLRFMIHPLIASNEKVKKETGYVFRYNTRQAFQDFVDSLGLTRK